MAEPKIVSATGNASGKGQPTPKPQAAPVPPSAPVPEGTVVAAVGTANLRTGAPKAAVMEQLMVAAITKAHKDNKLDPKDVLAYKNEVRERYREALRTGKGFEYEGVKVDVA